MLGGPGLVGPVTNTAAAPDIWTDTSGTRVVSFNGREGTVEVALGGDEDPRIHVHKQATKKMQDAQTGVYLVSQGFGVEGVVLSS